MIHYILCDLENKFVHLSARDPMNLELLRPYRAYTWFVCPSAPGLRGRFSLGCGISPFQGWPDYFNAIPTLIPYEFQRT